MKKIIITTILLSAVIISTFFLHEKMNGAESPAIAPNPSKKYKMVVYWAGLGEYEWAKRLEKASHKLGWECINCYSGDNMTDFEKQFVDKPTQSIEETIKQHKPDFIISLKEDKIFTKAVPNYLCITGVFKQYFFPNPWDSKKVLDFAGVLYASQNANNLKAFVEGCGKVFYGMSWYPSCASTDYIQVVPKKLFYCGFQWDGKRNGEEYHKMFSLLDQCGYLNVYGPKESWQCAPNSTKGLLPFDGESISRAIREAGVTLVSHAQTHMELETPTSRIFEAASSCSVIISDKHPFIMREFGDSVLYIDGDKNGDDLFKQIDSHMKWILLHPKEAEIMARKAHTIFTEKFTLEKQLQNLAELHEKIMSQKA
ncbi:MAG: glycosyltransferase family 1 protein [Parachlamydiaceae bacterium]|nr:glycosyltransferase family 1 protein [Parachlamydiaceae bacterium]